MEFLTVDDWPFGFFTSDIKKLIYGLNLWAKFVSRVLDDL